MPKCGSGIKPVEREKHIKKKIEKVCQYVKLGMTIDRSARLAGINPVTLYRWKTRAKAGEEPYKTYIDTFDIAIAEAEAILASRVHNASKHDYKAACWILERRYNETWGKKEHITQTYIDKVSKEIEEMSDEELEEFLKKELDSEE